VLVVAAHRPVRQRIGAELRHRQRGTHGAQHSEIRRPPIQAIVHK